jgi:tRNA dimethylallyltransferase
VHKLLPEDFVLTDPQRTARALEVFLETGTPLSQWQKLPRRGALIPDAYKILILPDKDLLLNRIIKRIPEMISGTALEEGKYIIENNLEEDRAIGTSQICKMLRGEISRDEAIDDWILKTKQYSKRQRTWYKTQFLPDCKILHVPDDADLEYVIKQIS